MSEQVVCIVNIGPVQRRRRLTFGIVTLGVTMGVAAVMGVMHVAPWWRAALFLPLVAAMTGVLQWREKT